MLEGWYCRTLANEQQATQMDEVPELNVDESVTEDSRELNMQPYVKNVVNYKHHARYLKRKLKFLIFENEFLHDALRSNQRRLLKASRDRAFLLDRLMQYEKPAQHGTDSEETESSGEEEASNKVPKKQHNKQSKQTTTNGTAAPSARGRKKKAVVTATVSKTEMKSVKKAPPMPIEPEEPQQGRIMTAAEVEQHLRSKQPIMQLLPERASATVPAEMFSNEPSLDSESNDIFVDDTSPIHMAAEECVSIEVGI